jgi:uncharacterized membrane protein YccC
MIIGSVWIFIVTYFATSTKVWSYFWSVVGITTLVIITIGSGDSKFLFENAMFRTLETGIGIIVYMLVSVFLWPRTNLGAIQKSSTKLLGTQIELLKKLSFQTVADEDLNKLRTTEVQFLTKLNQDLQAEGSENYEVSKNAAQWSRLQLLCADIMIELDNWYLSLKRLDHDVVHAAIPEFSEYVSQLEEELMSVQRALTNGNKTPNLKRDHDD